MNVKRMSITMLSNGMSHHQLPFCEYMAKQRDIDFYFIATKPLAEERLKMGYEDFNYSRNYIVRSYESEDSYKLAMTLANNSDFVIYGSAPYTFIRSRIRNKKWTFIYSERIFKEGLKDKKLMKKVISYFLHYAAVPQKRLAFLCASAYAAKDFRMFGLNPQRMYKWGYFPPDTNKDIKELLDQKRTNSFVWVGRMISLKHPELAILLAEKLKEKRVPFHLTMVGNGSLYEMLSDMIREKGLQQYVTMTGPLPKDEVRTVMEQSDILLATSDYAEGWGTVINEGMNSACAVVASHAMGATRFLIQDRQNGMIFNNGDVEELFEKIKSLLTEKDKKIQIQKQAFFTIKNEWNGENAGSKLIHLCHQLQSGRDDFHYKSGVCSLAKVNIDK